MNLKRNFRRPFIIWHDSRDAPVQRLDDGRNESDDRHGEMPVLHLDHVPGIRIVPCDPYVLAQ